MIRSGHYRSLRPPFDGLVILPWRVLGRWGPDGDAVVSERHIPEGAHAHA